MKIPPKKYRKIPFNDRQIKNTKPAEKAYKLADGHSLYWLVKPNGGKYWHLKYRSNGKEKRLSIGTYPAISLIEAREPRQAHMEQNTARAAHHRTEHLPQRREMIMMQWHSGFFAPTP